MFVLGDGTVINAYTLVGLVTEATMLLKLEEDAVIAAYPAEQQAAMQQQVNRTAIALNENTLTVNLQIPIVFSVDNGIPKYEAIDYIGNLKP